jgi:hypothetical protein
MERERTTTRTTVRDEPPRERVVEPAGPAMVQTVELSWGPIWAGVLTAFGIFFLFSLIAVAAGLELVDLGGAPAGDVPVNVLATIVTGIFLVVAFFAGGFTASWAAGRLDEGGGILHGFLVWALAIALILILAAAGLGQVFGAVGQIFAGRFTGGIDVEVDPQQLLEAFQAAAWQSVFAVVLAMASAVLGGLVGTREEIRGRDWSTIYRYRR